MELKDRFIDEKTKIKYISKSWRLLYTKFNITQSKKNW